ncbi:hypothetical protein LTR94_030926, partial [Friedmanniomyces endolithicus]
DGDVPRRRGQGADRPRRRQPVHARHPHVHQHQVQRPGGHGVQRLAPVGGLEHVRYCGSPLPLSFSEVGYRHQVLRIDLDGARAAAVEPLYVPRPVQLLRVPALPAPLEEALAALEALALDPDLPQQAWPYLEVRVLLDGPEPGLRARIEAVLAGKPVKLAKIEPTRKLVAASDEAEALSLDQLAQLQPDDIFRRLWRQKYGDE